MVLQKEVFSCLPLAEGKSYKPKLSTGLNKPRATHPNQHTRSLGRAGVREKRGL